MVQAPVRVEINLKSHKSLIINLFWGLENIIWLPM